MANPKKEWKRSDNLVELLSLLKTHRELDYQTLKAKLNISDPTLTEYIKLLEANGKIEHFSKSDDRRRTWYRIKPQSMETVEGDLLEYEAVKFLKSIEDPLVTYLKGKDGKSSVSIFLSNAGSVKGPQKKIFELMIKNYAENWLNFAENKGLLRPPKEDYKIAVVLTKEK
ncbi:MAG: transcriptional regulator [Candidatus Bathyarchaeia archaeon]